MSHYFPTKGPVVGIKISNDFEKDDESTDNFSAFAIRCAEISLESERGTFFIIFLSSPFLKAFILINFVISRRCK